MAYWASSWPAQASRPGGCDGRSTVPPRAPGFCRAQDTMGEEQGCRSGCSQLAVDVAALPPGDEALGVGGRKENYWQSISAAPPII
jgi:hypothetical protein